MIKTNISFDKAYDTVRYFLTPYEKGKNKGKCPLATDDKFTTFANNLKVLQIAAGDVLSMPTRAAKAQGLLEAVKRYHNGEEVFPASVPSVIEEGEDK